MKFKLKGDVPKDLTFIGVLQPGEIYEENRPDKIKILKDSPMIQEVKENKGKNSKRNKKPKGEDE